MFKRNVQFHISNDNTIVILSAVKTSRVVGALSAHIKHKVYRVAHISEFDNYEYYVKNQPYNLGYYLSLHFSKSVVYDSLEKAMEIAKKRELQIGYVKHGIVIKDTDMFYPGDF